MPDLPLAAPRHRIDRRSLVAGVTACLCWGSGNVSSKAALDHLAPLSLTLIQLICSAAVLWGFALARRRTPTGRHFWRLAWPGILQPGVAFAFAAFGLALTEASFEALLFATETLFIFAFAWPLLGERPGRATLGLALAAVLGVAMVAGTGDPATAGGSPGMPVAPHWLGAGLILTGVAATALYTVIIRGIAGRTDALMLLTANQTAGLVVIALAWAIWPATPGLDQPGPAIIALAGLSGLLMHAAPFFLFTLVLERVPASLAACSCR